MFHDARLMNLPFFSHKGLSIERLRAFCAVVETGSVIGAADGDPVRQSQISRQVKDLEDALQVRLFDRVNRRLIPTEVGHELAMMTTSYFAGLAEITNPEHQIGETIRIAGAETVFSGFIVPRFDRMREALPQFRFALMQHRTDEATQMVKTGRADVAVVRETANLEGLDRAALGIVRYQLAIPRCLLPGRQREGLGRLKGLPMATLSGTGELNRTLLDILDSAQAEVRRVAESDTFYVLRELVLTGTVAAVLPEQVTKSLPTEFVAVISLPELARLDRRVVVATHPRLPQLRPSVKEAISTLEEIWRP
jgi:DNA-binding transcriptional LysR family regulator